MYEQDSEPAIIADKMTRLLSEAEPPLKATQDQEVTTEISCVAFKQLNVHFKHLFDCLLRMRFQLLWHLWD